MKRLLTYGLLLLTILASHFVVSACQDDSDKTTIVMTFTTRVENPRLDETTGESAEVPKEQMKELRIIMAREDGTVIVNAEDYNVEDNPYSFSFNVPMMTYTERFQFIVIANESTLVSSDGTAIDLASIDDKDEFNNLKTCVIGQDGFSLGASQYIPQTIYWTQEITYGETTNIKKELLFVVGKITVEFENQTEEPQSLSNIRITGIGSASAGYLFKQTIGDDFVGTQHDASDITFTDVTNLAAGATSEELTYYTYPVGSVSSPTLFATWNGIEYNLPITEVTDEEGNVHPFTSLARNERLKIVITLTPAGDITVNYTIAAWEETPTNIGDKAPTTPENGYHVDTWGTGGIIDVGGGGGISWDIGTGTPILGEQMWEFELGGQNPEISDRISVHLPEDILVLGNKIILYFYCHTPNGDIPENGIIIQFKNSEDTVLKESVAEEDISYAWDETKTIRYVRYLTFNADVLSKLKKAWNSPEGTKALIVKPVNPDNTQQAVQIRIDQLVVIRPLND